MSVCSASSSRCIITIVESFVFPLSLQPSLSPFHALSFTSFCFMAVCSLRHVFPSLCFLLFLSHVIAPFACSLTLCLAFSLTDSPLLKL